jgi:hypothetical protein
MEGGEGDITVPIPVFLSGLDAGIRFTSISRALPPQDPLSPRHSRDLPFPREEPSTVKYSVLGGSTLVISPELAYFVC